MDRTEEVGNEATRTAVAMIRALANEDEQAFLDLWHGSEHQYFVLLALATVPLSMMFAVSDLIGGDPHENLDATLRMLAQR